MPLAILGFAVLSLFDVLEVSHQLGVARTELALIAAILAMLHVVTAPLAVRSLADASIRPIREAASRYDAASGISAA